VRGLPLAILALAAASPAAAQQPAAPSGVPAPAFDFALPPPAETGKPLIRALRGDGAPPPGRLQLRGNLDRDGAVELRARAFSW
jgi:hypothetical protein